MPGCRALTDEELERAMASFGGLYALRDRCLFILGTKLGYRVGELLSMRIEHVLDTSGRVRTAVKVRQTKQGRARETPLNQGCRDAITSWIHSTLATQLKLRDQRQNPLFPSDRRAVGGGLKPVGYRRVLNVLHASFAPLPGASERGKLGSHAMRKTFARRALERLDGRLSDLVVAMDHARADSTMAYIQTDAAKVHAKLKDL